MIGAIRYLKGYLKIKVWGYSPERFMNLCTNRGIVLWGVAGYGGAYTMYVSLADFYLLRDIVKKTKTRVAILERYGLPFFMKDVKRRKMFVLGVLFCLCFLLYMSRFVWAIEFLGNERITQDELSGFLAAQGVGYGTPKSDLKLEELEESLRASFSQVTWTSVRLTGTKLIVQIKENELPTREEQQNAQAKKFLDGADLVAAKTGIVTSILTRSGVPQVKQGDSVQKGDILIAGPVPVINDDGTIREWEKKIADGDVVLEYEEPIQLFQPFSYTYKNYTGRTRSFRFLSVFGHRVSFPPLRCNYVKYDAIMQEERLRLFGQIDLPVFSGRITCREYLPVDAVYDEESALALLEKRFGKIIEGFEEKGVHIIQKDVKIVKGTSGLLLSGSLTVHQEAVVLQASDPEEQALSGV